MSRRFKPTKARPVRWGHLSELDKRARVGNPGSPVFAAYPLRLKKLAAWRRMHAVSGSHVPVQMSGTRQGIRPSSNMSLAKMLTYIARRQ